MTAQAVVYPLDVLRRRMQLGPAARGGIVSDRTWYNQAPRARIRAHPSAPALTPPAARARQARAALCSEEGGSHVTVCGHRAYIPQGDSVGRGLCDCLCFDAGLLSTVERSLITLTDLVGRERPEHG